jgi:hypothetical protein
MVIYMDDYRATQISPTASPRYSPYAENVMRTDWNRAVLPLLREMPRTAPNPELPDDITSVMDVDEFLARVYGPSTLV